MNLSQAKLKNLHKLLLELGHELEFPSRLIPDATLSSQPERQSMMADVVYLLARQVKRWIE